MKTLKLIIALAIAVACIAYIVSLNKQQAPPPTAPRPAPRATARPRGQITVTRGDAQTTAPTWRATPRRASAPAGEASSTPEPSPSPTADTAEIEREAREALPRVGANTNATNTWLEAINNPEVPAATRAALIGGLADEGFSDADNPGEADLPLIQARMQLVERIAPQAIDNTNTTAFNEVYRALQQFAERLAQDNNNNNQQQPQQEPPPQQDQQ